MSSAEENDKTGSVDCGPQVEVQYSVPSFEAPYPERVKEMITPNNTILNWGGVKIAKISSEIVVKLGPHVTLTEAKNMSLDRVWETYDSITKAQITTQLKNYIGELRQIGNGNGSYYIGSIGPGPVTDPILENYHNKGE
ncbi:hypothetical protein AnigIFM63309_006601 [Aspergillus niger]|nr:hypothetical protein AnigIFM63309_006601 [Aspergillus niger]